jgi:CheY-like chemotaxis protein
MTGPNTIAKLSDQTASPTSANGVNEGFLLVEDDAGTVKVMTRLLKSTGIAVESVGSVKEGLAALGRLPAVVILDLTLPDGSGLQVLEAIRAANMRCKVAIVSGSIDPETFRRARAARPDAIFSKPLDFEDFVQWLCEAFPVGVEEEAHEVSPLEAKQR